MTLDSLPFIGLCLLLRYGFAWEMSHAPIVMRRSKSIFNEDEKAEFYCKVQPQDFKLGMQGIWYLKDPKINEKLFYTNNIYSSTIPETLETNELKLSLIMRRDFSGADLYCKILDGKESSSYRLSSVQKTIPIDDVRLLPITSEPDKAINIFCEMKKSFKHKINCVLRTDDIMKSANDILVSKDKKITTCVWREHAAFINDLNGLRLECVVFATSRHSKTGLVTSPMVKVDVSYIELVHPRLSFFKGQSVNIPFLVKSKTALTVDKLNMTVRRAGRVDVDFESANFTLRKKAESHQQKAVEVTAHFSPTQGGNYSLRYKSQIFFFKSAPVDVEMKFFEFASSGLFASELNIQKGEAKDIIINVTASFRPVALNFHLFRIQEEAGTNLVKKQRSLVKETVVSADNSTADLYQVQLQIMPIESGTYKIFYKEHDNLVASEAFRIRLHYGNFAGQLERFRGVGLAVVVLVPLAFVVFLSLTMFLFTKYKIHK